MKVNTMIRSLKTTRYALLLLPFFQLSYANLTVETAKTIQGTVPRLSEELENDLKNTGELKPLFGLRVGDKSYYGQKEIDEMPIPVNEPFKNKIVPAKIKQPDENEYFDRDGDKLSYITPIDPIKDIEMQWYHTGTGGKQIPFTPEDNETICTMAAFGHNPPITVKLSTDLVLFSEYGDPSYNTYPNKEIQKKPSATFTVLEDVAVCYAKPSLKPNNATSSGKKQWSKENGFYTQSNTDPTKNFPTTGFVYAQFELVLSRPGIEKDYDWYVKKGGDLVTVTKNAKTNRATITFNGPDAMDPGKAWNHVMGGSGNGYPVIIEGKNTKTGKTIQYAFTITKWFDSWKQVYDKSKWKAVKGTQKEVEKECAAKSGHYRVSRTEDMSNAIELVGDETTLIQFTREIGTLISEWGEVDQNTYPNSFGPDSGGSEKRFYVYDPLVDGGRYCDIHVDHTAKYHCRTNEKENKNAVCASYRP